MLKAVILSIVVLFLGPLLTHAVWWQLRDHPRSWTEASWASAGMLPAATDEPDAVVHVLAGRTGRWKGIFAHHSWIVVKPKGASQYTRYDVVGWGTALRVDSYAADGRWYGNTPQIVVSLRGAEAERAIPAIRRAVADYPHAGSGSYTIWPGPNSNTFVASVARQVPALAPALLPTAMGKDFAGWPVFVGAPPSGNGLQFSVGGLLGLTVGWVEGLEINLLGLVAGIDVQRPALKLPGWGRLGLGAG